MSTIYPSRLPVFVCYAHKDNEGADPAKLWLDRLLEQLAPLALQDQVCAWSDKDIEIGEDWHDRIQQTLENTKAAVLLVSPAFLASKYIRSSELPVLLKHAKDKGVKILPVIVRHCLFKETTFKYPDPVHGPENLSLATLQTANPPSTPLNSLPEHEQDKVLLGVAQHLLAILQTSNTVSSSPLSQKNGDTYPSKGNPVVRQASMPGGQPEDSQGKPATAPPQPLNFSGTTKIEFCDRLGHDWKHLADVLGISPADQARFGQGEEARGMWVWLENRRRLPDLVPALAKINREDLVQLLKTPKE
jgi:hypothetical protein